MCIRDREDLQDPEFKSVIKDMQSSMGKMSGDWDQTTKKMEEVGTGSQISGSKGDDKVESTTKKKTNVTTIKGDLTTITFDGKTYPRGAPGLGGFIPGGGEGGSTYHDSIENERSAPVIDKVTGNPGERTAPKLDRGGSVSSPPPPAKISTTTPSAPVSNITPERKGQDIVVVDDAPPPPDLSSTGGSSSTIYVIEESLNSMVDQQILLDLAYT